MNFNFSQLSSRFLYGIYLKYEIVCLTTSRWDSNKIIKIHNSSISDILSDELYCNICGSNIDPSQVDEHITSDKHMEVKNKILKEFRKLLADAEITDQSVYWIWKE